MSMVFCRGCGQSIHESAHTCPHCGATQGLPPAQWSGSRPLTSPASTASGTHTKSWNIVFLLVFFAGFLGAHRFYVGKVGTGIAQLLTFGGMGFWLLWDFVQVCRGRFTDAQGNVIAHGT